MRTRIEHIWCDNCGKELTEDIYSLTSEGSEWDTCSPECHDACENRKYGEQNVLESK